MKKVKTFLIGTIACFLMSGCSYDIVSPGLVTNNGIGDEEKKGTASYTVTLGIFKPMDADRSIHQAAQNGDITKISTVDRKRTVGIFSTTYTTVVTGK